MTSLNKIKRSLLQEIKVNEDTIHTKDSKWIIEIMGHKFVNSILKTQIYDSLETSGNLLKLNLDLQKIITSLYIVIKYKNNLMINCQVLMMFKDVTSEFDYKYSKAMVEADENIKERIDKVLKILSSKSNT